MKIERFYEFSEYKITNSEALRAIQIDDSALLFLLDDMEDSNEYFYKMVDIDISLLKLIDKDLSEYIDFHKNIEIDNENECKIFIFNGIIVSGYDVILYSILKHRKVTCYVNESYMDRFMELLSCKN